MRADPTRAGRIVPSSKNGQPNGVKLYAIRPSAYFARLGLTNGDTVHQINGADVQSGDELLPAALLSRPRVVLTVTRRGQPLTLVIDVAD